MDDLEKRLAHRVQISTDYFKPYPEAIEDVFGSDVDYGVLVKLFGTSGDAGREHYAPSRCLGTQKLIGQGELDEDLICTSHVERQNLTIRMSIRPSPGSRMPSASV